MVLGNFFQPNQPPLCVNLPQISLHWIFLIGFIQHWRVTLPLTSRCTLFHSRFVSYNSSHQCTIPCASFFESVPVISSTLCVFLLISSSNFSSNDSSSVLYLFFSLLSSCISSVQLLALWPEQQQLQQCLRSAVWECVTASCRRDWRWLGLLRPHCSSWQGRSWELFNSRRIGGSASHHLPPSHTYTQMRMHLCIPRHPTARTTLCVCPR